MNRYVAILVVLAACDSSDGTYVPGQPDGGAGGGGGADANHPGQTRCGQPEPTSAPPSIWVRGKTAECCDNSATDLSGTTVEVWRTAGTAPLATAMTDTAGSYNLTVLTTNMPITGYLHATHVGLDDTYHYPSGALADNVMDPHQMQLMSPQLEAELHNDGKPNPSRGVVAVQASECNGVTILGATVTAPGAYVRYMTTQGTFVTAPDSTTIGAVLDAPLGPLMITTTASSRMLRTSYVDVRANAYTYVDVEPQ